MTYKEARELYLKFYNVPDIPSELNKKFVGLENLRKKVVVECGEVLDLVKEDFDKLSSSRYVYDAYEPCVAKNIIHDILVYAYDKEEHTHYKNILEYIEDEADMTDFRDSQWMKCRQITIAKNRVVKLIRNMTFGRNGSSSDEVVREYDPQWQYSEHGSYGVYKRYKDNPEFSILMIILERNSNKSSAQEEFEMLLLLKELDIQISKTHEMMSLAGMADHSCDKPNANRKPYKLDYALVQDIHDFCEKHDLYVDYDVFEECVRTANFKRILKESNRGNCWKCMLTHISKTIRGGNQNQADWYDNAVASIGISKSDSRKGVGNLPVGFDDELSDLVSKRAKSKRT